MRRHVGEAFANRFEVGIWQRTHKLIATEAHDQVVGAQTRPQGVGDGDEKRISGKVTLDVVDLLQPINIDESDHKLFGSTTCTVYLPLKLLHPAAPPPDATVSSSARQAYACGHRPRPWWRARIGPDRGLPAAIGDATAPATTLQVANWDGER